MSVSDVRGTGNSAESSVWFGGDKGLVALPIRSRVEVVAGDDLTDDIVNAILVNARSGETGDGKVFVERISDAIRVRTLERGESAI